VLLLHQQACSQINTETHRAYAVTGIRGGSPPKLNFFALNPHLKRKVMRREGAQDYFGAMVGVTRIEKQINQNRSLL